MHRTKLCASVLAISIALVLQGVLLVPVSSVRGAPAGTGEETPSQGPALDLMADTWTAVDGLGRVLPGYDRCGPRRPDKTVAMFYWTWHLPDVNPGARTGTVLDNSRIIARALASGQPPQWRHGGNYFWGEPELGYYRTTDPFVLRRHASMLADAGVDVIVFDTTNPPWTWKEGYMALCREFRSMRRLGNPTPYIAFMCPFGDPREVVHRVFRELYQPGLYRELWFRWEGKPLILADPRFFRKEPAIREFFTFRRPIPGYWTAPRGPGEWPWLQVYPQHGFPDAQGRIEIVSAGVAQNAIPGYFGPAPMSHKAGAMGRSWHDGRRDPNAEAVLYGLNFQEQWKRVLALDPRVVFITGWNEWTAVRLRKFGPFNDQDHPYYPGALFIDEYNQEYSRDIEPMKGGHGDAYYWQLVAWVRLFKGVRKRPLPEGPARIDIDGRFDDWAGVRPEYRDTVGDTIHRRHRGYGGKMYVDETGRNDIMICKAAYDSDNLYFYVETYAPLTAPEGDAWMLLFIDADQDPRSGWNGYDYIIGRGRDLRTGEAVVQRAAPGGGWTAVGSVPFRYRGNRMELAIPRKLVGLAGSDGPPGFDFHWADNIGGLDIAEFALHGDSAPNRRFNYRFGPDPAKRPAGLLDFFPSGMRRGADGRIVFPPPHVFRTRDIWWIWRAGVPRPGESAPIETVVFRRRFRLPRSGGKEPRAAILVVADNQAVIEVNGGNQSIVSGWTPATVLTVPLHSGENEIVARVSNAGDAPNPAGFAAQIVLLRAKKDRAGKESYPVLASTGDGKWEAALAPPSRDVRSTSGLTWRPAVRIGRLGCAPWGAVDLPDDAFPVRAGR